MLDEMTPEMLAQEEAEARQREEQRARERTEREKQLAAEQAAEEARLQEERQRMIENEKRKRRQEEEAKRLGSDVIQPLPPAPPSVVDDRLPDVMKAWFLNEVGSKPTYCCASLRPNVAPDAPVVRLSLLRDLGVLYYKINLNDFSIVNQIVKERVYKHTDELRLSQTCKDESFHLRWFQEHCNEDEQIRLVTDGSCYLDVRSRDNDWIRLWVRTGDLVVLAPGLYHRGCLDEDDYCALFRVFRESARWAPLVRSDPRTEDAEARQTYLRLLEKGSVGTEMGFK